MLDKFLSWLKSKNINSHTIAAAAFVAFSFYATHQDVQDFVNGLFASHPKILGGLALTATLYLKYSHSSKPRKVWTPEQRAAYVAAKTTGENK